MDLIPILSTIVLVATLVTLLFSVTAYVVYKVKERKVNGVANGHGRYAPQPVAGQPMHEAPAYPRQISVPELGRMPVNPPAPSLGVNTASVAPQQNPEPYIPERIFQRPQIQQPQGAGQAPAASGEESKGAGFFIYTPYGYVPVQRTKTEGNLRWR